MKFSLTTESAMKKVEDINTLVRSLSRAAKLMTRLKQSSDTQYLNFVLV